mgnify:CR=1 FL=1
MWRDEGQVLDHGIPAVAHNHDEPVCAQDVRSGHGVPDEAAPADLVEHLGSG